MKNNQTVSDEADPTTEPATPMLRADGVEKRFGETAVLKGIDLTLDKQEILLLMGPNGVGKSVFMSCLAGGTESDAGTIELLGDRSPTEARSAISVMLQGRMADPDLTGRENLQFYRDLHPAGTDYWMELIDLLELTDDIDRPVKSYSGGMVRKLEIAITLTLDVPLYMLDEPTAELDLSMIRVLHDVILEHQSAGKTFMITSHAPLDAQIADRISFINDGRIVANGPPESLLESLPKILRVRGGVPPAEQLVGNRLFQRGDEVRGFISEETDVESIKAEFSGSDGTVRADIDHPSYTDLFNYQVYIRSNSATSARFSE